MSVAHRAIFPLFSRLHSTHLQMEDEGVAALAEAYGPKLTRLDLSNNKKVTELGLQTVGRHCGQLKSLNLTGCSIGDAALMKVAGCTGLEVCSWYSLPCASCYAALGVRCSRRLLGAAALRFASGMPPDTLKSLCLRRGISPLPVVL